MIHVEVQLWPRGDRTNARVLGSMNIVNVGGDAEHGDYRGILWGEYTPKEGRSGIVKDYARQRNSVWSLVGAFLKLWGHTKHSPAKMSKEPKP